MAWPGSGTAAVSSSFNAGVLGVASDASDAIVIACTSVGGTVQINGTDPASGVVSCSLVTQLSVSGGPGANLIDLSAVNAGNFPALTTRTVDAGAGADTLRGSAGADVLIGGPDADVVDGNQGADIAFLGDGDDTFSWQPGDGNDVVEGQGGSDRMRFEGSNASEAITIGANGQRLRFLRNVGSVTIDADELEQVEYHAVGGADTVEVQSLAGTDVDQVVLRFAALLDGSVGDGTSDSVTIVGDNGADSLGADAQGGTITATHGLTNITLDAMEPAMDSLSLLGGDGNDSLVVGLGLADQVATLTVDGGPGTDTVSARGGSGADQVQVSAAAPFVTAAGLALIDALATENLRIEGLGGPDMLSVTGNVAALFALTLDGGADNDELSGGNGADVLLGGAGADLLDGNQGADTAFLGDGDDVFRWDPGDGNDVLEGQAGVDTLMFNASAASENLAFAPNGQRVLLTRNVGLITLDLNDIEQAEINAVGGTDSLVVNDLTGTDLTGVRARLSGILGGTGGDGVADTITVHATPAADVLAVSAAGGVVSVVRGGFRVDLFDTEPANDRLVVHGAAGDDTFTITPAAPLLVAVTLDGGSASSLPGDIVSFAGEAVAESYTIAPNAARVALSRTAPAGFMLDLDAVEWLQLMLDAGADTVNTQGLPTTSQILDGGSPGAVPGDTLNVAGFSGDVFASPIQLPGAAPIVHSNFEQSTNQQVIEAFLSGAQEIPRNPSSGRGHGTVTLNAGQDAILVFLEYSGLAGNNTLVHIHGPAPRGVAAAPIIDLPASGGSSGTFTAGPFPITPAQRSDLRAGRWYFNVHSTAPGSAGGEIRGQLDNILFRDGFD
jgi:Ca2+-binding RTX toxin-like protein